MPFKSITYPLDSQSLKFNHKPSAISAPSHSIPSLYEPPCFLTLPREIRQKILYYTFDNVHGKDLNSKYTCSDYVYWDGWSSELEEWACVLAPLHPILKADLPFVLEQRKKKLFADFPFYAVERYEKEVRREDLSCVHDRGRCDPYSW